MPKTFRREGGCPESWSLPAKLVCSPPSKGLQQRSAVSQDMIPPTDLNE